ncbi:MAG: FG-GAP-like repeat-containing protein [Bryobacteraceae bacterium]
MEVTLTENTVQPKFNGGSLGGVGGRSIPDSEKDGYGQIGFYVGGTGEVHIKNFMYKDILNHTWAPEETSKNFKEEQVDPHYYSWSAAVADFNNDGKPDIAAGPFYYLGPDYRVGKQIYTPVSFNPTSEWPIPAMVNLAYDFTGDGWPDILQMAGNAGNGTGFLFVNPKGQSRHWQRFVTIAPIGNEETLFKDIDGDGRPDLIHAGMNRLRYSTFDPKNGTRTIRLRCGRPMTFPSRAGYRRLGNEEMICTSPIRSWTKALEAGWPTQRKVARS